MKWAAFLWTCSICLIWVTCWGFQIEELYSNFGRTNVWYALSLTILGHYLKLRLTNPRTREAFDVMLSICWLYFILSVNSTPKYRSCFTTSNVLFFILYLDLDLFLSIPIFIITHLSLLNSICQVSLHSTSLLRSSCRIRWSCGESIWR